MNENELLKNFAKLLGPAGENVLQSMEEKRAKEEKFLESLAVALGPESKKALSEINEKEALEKQIREEKILKKKQEVEEQRAKEEKLLRELNNSLSRLIDNNQDQLPLIAQEISQTIADVNAEIADEPVMEVTATVEDVVEDLQPLPQLPIDDIVNQTVMALSKASPDAVQDVADEIPDGFRKELDIIKKSIADLHRMASRHSQMGGGGEVWLKKLDDVSYQSVSSATDGQVLTYDADINKWIAADPTGGPGGAAGQGYYASAYYYDGNVYVTNVTTEYIVPINNFFANNGVILGSNNDIIPLFSGTYEISYSIQFTNGSNNQQNIDVWIRQNETDDPFTNSRFTINAKQNAFTPGYLIATTPTIINCTANQRIQIMFAADSTNVYLASIPSVIDNPHTTPATPAVIITFKQIASTIQGYTGSTGSLGYTGSAGSLGYTGSKGDIGYTGSKGDIGYTGSAGYIGADGYSGSRGDTGYTGSHGYTGSKGDPGDPGGYTGSRGADGYTGSKGDLGYTGSKGDTGYTGSAGYIGADGYTGSTGYTGSKGDIGYTGSAGLNGISSGLVLYIDASTGTSPVTGNLQLIPITTAQQTVNTSVNAATPTTVGTFITPANTFSSTLITGGNWNVWLYSKTSIINQPIRIWADIQEVASDGTTLLANLVIGSYSTGTAVDTTTTALFDFSGYVSATSLANTQSRLKVTLHAQSTTGSPTLSSYYRDGTISYLTTTLNANIQGPTGYTGSQGYTGSHGDTGYTGSHGDTGYTGSKGDTGYNGSTGFTGSIGYTGSQGIQGYTGSQGGIGFTGSIGYTGSLPTGIVSNLSNTITIESGYNFLPQDDALQDLGSLTKRFKTLYLSGNTLFVGNVALSDSGGSLTVTQANGYIAPVATSLGLGNTDGQMLLSNSITTYWHSLYTLSATPPSDPNYGDIWYYTVDDKPYMWVQDSNSSFWFDFSPSAG